MPKPRLMGFDSSIHAALFIVVVAPDSRRLQQPGPVLHRTRLLRVPHAGIRLPAEHRGAERGGGVSDSLRQPRVIVNRPARARP